MHNNIQTNGPDDNFEDNFKNMLSLNVSFSSWQKFLKLMYTQSVTPGESYDAVIVLKNTTPTKFFD